MFRGTLGSRSHLSPATRRMPDCRNFLCLSNGRMLGGRSCLSCSNGKMLGGRSGFSSSNRKMLEATCVLATKGCWMVDVACIRAAEQHYAAETEGHLRCMHINAAQTLSVYSKPNTFYAGSCVLVVFTKLYQGFFGFF